MMHCCSETERIQLCNVELKGSDWLLLNGSSCKENSHGAISRYSTSLHPERGGNCLKSDRLSGIPSGTQNLLSVSADHQVSYVGNMLGAPAIICS